MESNVEQAEAAADKDTARGRLAGRGRWLALVAVVMVAGVLIYLWRTAGQVSTDDAQVDGHITQVAARVGGTVTKVNVKENQYVEAGVVLVELDPRDYQVAVDRARAELADAQANASGAATGIPLTQVSSATGARRRRTGTGRTAGLSYRSRTTARQESPCRRGQRARAADDIGAGASRAEPGANEDHRSHGRCRQPQDGRDGASHSTRTAALRAGVARRRVGHGQLQGDAVEARSTRAAR